MCCGLVRGSQDDAVPYLARFPALRTLDFWRSSDGPGVPKVDAIPYLLQCTALRRLTLWHVQFPAPLVLALCKALTQLVSVKFYNVAAVDETGQATPLDGLVLLPNLWSLQLYRCPGVTLSCLLASNLPAVVTLQHLSVALAPEEVIPAQAALPAFLPRLQSIWVGHTDQDNRDAVY